MARIVLFDIDMTLISTLRAGRAAIDVAFRREFGLDDPVEGVSFDGRTDHAIFMEVIGLNHIADGDLVATYRRAVDAYLAELPNALREREGFVLPGVEKLLDALRETHGPIGLATGNLRRGAQLKLGHFGLWERFADGGFGDDTPIRAEVVRAGIEAMARVLDIEPNPRDVIVLGDTPLDVEAAHLAGARALAVATGRYDVAALRASGAEFVLPDLGDTGRVLEILAS